MATDQMGLSIGSEIAASDLSGSQFLGVKLVAGGVDLVGVGEAADGILQNKPKAGEVVNMMVAGKSKCVASAALAKGASVSFSAAGKVKAAAAGEYIVGRLMEASTAADDIVSVLITRPGRLA